MWENTDQKKLRISIWTTLRSVLIMLMTVKNMSQFGQNIYMHLKDLTEFFQEIIWLIGF